MRHVPKRVLRARVNHISTHRSRSILRSASIASIASAACRGKMPLWPRLKFA